MNQSENVIHLNSFGDDKAVRAAIDEQQGQLLKKYQYDFNRFTKFCEEQRRELDYQSVLVYLHKTITDEKLKRSTFDRRVAAIKKHLKLVYGIVPTFDQLNDISQLKGLYKKDEHSKQRNMQGQQPTDKNELLEEIRALTLTINDTEYPDVRMIAIALVNLVTANRPSEMVRLKISDFDFERAEIDVNMVKQNSDKRKALTPEAVEAVKRYVEAYRLEPSDYFVSRVTKHQTVMKGKSMTETGYTKIMQQKLSIAPYTLRKTQITSMHQQGADLATIARQSGHKSLATIQKHYLDIDTATVKKYL